jgi:lipopolysaccharide export LptBFGC system permease protein LptF
MYRRLITPFYILIVGLIASLLIIKSKNDFNYPRFKLFIFVVGISLIIFSEISIEFISNNFLKNLILVTFPLTATFIIYFFLKSKSKFINS